LSQPPKKSGSRDINELKARLGLKKGTGAPPAARPNGSAAPSGGVVPPPGLSVPPPPGAAPPPPVVPNAADDPFGAMNAMAQIGSAQRAPEIVIVNDGKPVESVSAGNKTAAFGKYAALAIVPFVLGIAIRGVSKDANAYNDGIKGAKLLLGDVKSVKKGLVAVNDKIANTKDKTGGREITNALKAIEQIELRPDVFKYKQNVGGELAQEVMAFYAAFAELKAMAAEHQKSAKADDLAIAAARANQEKATLPKEFGGGVRFAVVLWNPSEDEQKTVESAPVGARIVEIGPPYCADGKIPSSGSCSENNPFATFAIRYNPGAPWQRGDLYTGGGAGSSFPNMKVIPMSSSGVLDMLVQDCARGAEKAGDKCQQNLGGGASAMLYQKRLAAVLEKLAEVIDRGNKVEGRLAPKANEAERFSFFM